MAQPHFMERLRARRSGADAMRAEAFYRRRIGLLRLLLPAAALGVIVALVAWPILRETAGSFRLGLSGADLSISGRDEMSNPHFVGVDADDQPYSITAEVAMRPDDGGDAIFLVMPKADITLAGGDWVLIEAEQGFYDQTAETIDLTGNVALFTDDGFEVHSDRVRFDLRQGTAVSDAPVQGQGPWGRLNSTGFRYAPKGGVFHFDGRPRLVLYAHRGDAEG